MPTNRKRTSRIRNNSMAFEETIKQFLLTGEKPERATPAWALYTSRFFDGGKEYRRNTVSISG